MSQNSNKFKDMKNEDNFLDIIEDNKIKQAKTLIHSDEILDFFKREKMAQDKFNPFLSLEELTDVIKLNDVNEIYIYHYLKLIKDCENTLKLKTLKLGLNKKHFEELYKDQYINQKEKFINDINEICNCSVFADIYLICKMKKDEISGYFNKENLSHNILQRCCCQKKIVIFSDLKGLMVNQPIDFENENYMYLTLRDHISHHFLQVNHQNLKEEQKKLKLFLPLFNNINKYDDKIKFQIIFSFLEWNDIDDVQNFFIKKFEEEKTIEELNNNGFQVNIDNENNFIGTFKTYSKIIKIKIPKIQIFHLNSIEMMIQRKTDDFIIDNERMIYDNIELLKCVKLKYTDIYNYYTPDITTLKEIIYSILNSEAVKEYSKRYTDYECSNYAFENLDFFNKLWENKFHFLPFNNNSDTEAETFRIYSRIFFNGLPCFKPGLNENMNIYRLFNYSYFIVIMLHEILGHFEKILIYFINNNVRVNTNDHLEYDEENIIENDSCSEEENFINENYRKYSPKFYINKKSQNNNGNKLERNNIQNKYEGGKNIESIFFGTLISDNLMTINECLFILNINSYKSLKHINYFPYLDKCYNFSLYKSREYSNYLNYSNEIIKLLVSLNIKVDDLKKEDIYIIKILDNNCDSNNWKFRSKRIKKNPRCIPPSSANM